MDKFILPSGHTCSDENNARQNIYLKKYFTAKQFPLYSNLLGYGSSVHAQSWKLERQICLAKIGPAGPLQVIYNPYTT